MNYRALLSGGILFFAMSAGCCGEEKPRVAVSLRQYGLPVDVFERERPGNCQFQYQTYRFVHWLRQDVVAVGFSESPSCSRTSQHIAGRLKVITFRNTGEKLAEMELGYESGDGQFLSMNTGVWAGPVGSLAIETVASTDSSSKLNLFTSDLRPLKEIPLPPGVGFQGVTFSDHALILRRYQQDTEEISYEFIRGAPLESSSWGIKTEARESLSFGEDTAAWNHCDMKFKTEVSGNTTVSQLDGAPRCRLEVALRVGSPWSVDLKGGDMADILAVLRDGRVVAELGNPDTHRRTLMCFGPDKREDLPWENPSGHDPLLAGTTEDFSRYAAFQTNDNALCEGLGKLCSANGTFLIWDKLKKEPILRRTFPKNGRAELAPDGRSYASFESGEMRFYDVP
jgi:hypothetical protein